MNSDMITRFLTRVLIVLVALMPYTGTFDADFTSDTLPSGTTITLSR